MDASMETPFNMSFDDLVKAVESNGAAPMGAESATANANVETQGGETSSFDDLVAQAQATGFSREKSAAAETSNANPTTASGGMPSFDDLVAQAQAAAAGASQTQTASNAPITGGSSAEAAQSVPSFDDLVAQAQAASKTANVETANTDTTAATDVPSFDDLVAQAQAAADMAKGNDAPSNENATLKEAPKEESSVETAGDAASAMNPPEMEGSRNEDEAEAKSDPPAEEKPKKGKGRGKKGRTKAEETKPEEVPEDATESYRVDIFANNGVTKPETPLLEMLFSAEEVMAIRADIRAFVRKELKLAVVDAVKEMLHDFD